VRIELLAAIAECGQKAHDGINIVFHSLADETVFVRRQAVQTAAKISPNSSDVLAKLQTLLETESSPTVRAAIASAIGELGPIAGLAARQLGELARLDDMTPVSTEQIDDLMIRIEAARSLSRIDGDPRSIPWLIEISKNKDLDVM